MVKNVRLTHPHTHKKTTKTKKEKPIAKLKPHQNDAITRKYLCENCSSNPVQS